MNGICNIDITYKYVLYFQINLCNPQNKLVNVRLKHNLPIVKFLAEKGIRGEFYIICMVIF